MTSAKNVHDVLACISLSFDAEENAMQVLLLRIMTHVLESSVIRLVWSPHTVTQATQNAAVLEGVWKEAWEGTGKQSDLQHQLL